MSTFFLNTSNLALTKSSEQTFVRRWRVGSQIYGVNSTGVYLVGGSNDDGIDFDSVIKTADNELNAPEFVRVPEISVEGEGALMSALIYDGLAVSDGEGNENTHIIKFGKGGKAKKAAILLKSNSENLKIRSIKLMAQQVGLGGL